MGGCRLMSGCAGCAMPMRSPAYWPASGACAEETWAHCKPVGGGVSELRLDHGPGYRVYFGQRGRTLVVLLCGGDKRTQERDIRQAQ